MKHLWLVTLVGASLAAGQNRRAEAVNINERYTVESASVSGVDESKVSKGLREDLQKLVGEKFSQQRVTELLKRLKKEFPNRSTWQRVSRGEKPEHVKLELVVGRRFNLNTILAPTKGNYHSKQGWSGVLSVSPDDFGAHNRFSFGILSNGDDLLERFAGLTAGYERTKLGTDRVHLAFQFESYHQIWNRATLDELQREPDVPGIYRTRQNFQPAVTFFLAEPLKLTVGTSFQRFQTQFPAARTEAANAVITSLRYDRQLEDSAANRHRLEAGYGLRAATRTLESDFVYARHTWDVRYRFRRGDNRLEVKFTSGVISGRAPLFERFVLGNSRTLRGWSKFEVTPLGASRMAHNSLEYRYKYFQVVYDAGAAWNRGQRSDPKHSLGLGFRHHDFSLLVAFPVRSGRVEPMFIAGFDL
jgi:hypothetical protein